MKVQTKSSIILKPIYDGEPPSIVDSIPLSIFDKVNYNTHVAVVCL